ncbi:MAG TPA: SIS domain-containing protein, partial [Chloroflexi bacterium]|nr:SIS domain-containing protein [Chloroflexota bacterium]
MNLDNYENFTKLDPHNMLAHIDGLPTQIQTAWQYGSNLELPEWQDIQQVVIAGMGGSAIGADLLVAYIQSACLTPVFVHRDYDLPAWAYGAQTLVIVSSHSGNTEETVSIFNQARANGCLTLTITTNGKLEELSKRHGLPLWKFDYKSQPRAAVGYSFSLLLAALTRLGLIPDPSEEVISAVETMRAEQAHIKADIPVVKNPAKRLAGQLIDRWVTVIGADILAPVARRWKTQINEIAKAWAQFEFLPEADHNSLAGSQNPQDMFSHLMVLFLQAPSNHPRNQLRSQLTSKAFMLQGMGTDTFYAKGNTPLAHMWSTLHFGDYLAYYLAMAYEV